MFNSTNVNGQLSLDRKIPLVILFLFLLNFNLYSQEVVENAKTYISGMEITGPRGAISLLVPPNWSGFLDANTSLFLLSLDTAYDANMVFRSEETTLEDIRERWQLGNDAAVGLAVEEEIEQLGENKIALKFKNAYDNTRKGYALAICGDYGFCGTLIFTSDAKYFSNYEKAVNKFVDQLQFNPPKSGPYVTFNWKEELSEKYLFNYETKEASRKQNELWLCLDGSFTAKLIRKGLFKDEAKDYQGNQKGSYELSGIGPKGKLTLTIKKKEPIEIDLEIKEEILYLNGNRFNIAFNQKCK